MQLVFVSNIWAKKMMNSKTNNNNFKNNTINNKNKNQHGNNSKGKYKCLPAYSGAIYPKVPASLV
jgi:hypothetical protein